MSNKDGVMLSGDTEVAFGRFGALKGALKMEKVGLKTRGGALRPKLAAEFGLKKTDSHDKFIQHCLAKMTELYEAKHGTPPVPPFK